jgi:hypothetical protein
MEGGREGGKEERGDLLVGFGFSIMKYIPLLIDYGRILCG